MQGVLANTRSHVTTQFILYSTQVGIFFKKQWEVVRILFHTAGSCKMMVLAHNACQSGIYGLQ